MNNNAIVIGDLHGKQIWKKFADIPMLLKAEPESAGFGAFEPEYDFYIFLGDYTDAYYLSNTTIHKNLEDLIAFKKLYPKNVILIWGNHDVHYALDNPLAGRAKYYCTGNRPEAHFILYEIFNRNYDLFQLAFEHDNYLFTHAGVHKGWWKYRFLPQFERLMKDLEKFNVKYEPQNIADYLNIAFRHRLECIFDVDLNRGGNKNVGGPLWLDKKLANKPIPGYNQVVGHNRVEKIHTFKNKDGTITFIDTLDFNEFNSDKFLTINF